MAPADSSSKGKAPLPPQTQSRSVEPDSDDERDNEIRGLKNQIQTLIRQLDEFGGNYNTQYTGIRDHLEQLDAQVIGSAPISAIPGGPKLAKAETFDGTRSKLRGFLT
jgi:hypothetical protein